MNVSLKAVLKKLSVFLMILSLSWTTVACSSAPTAPSQGNFTNNVSQSINQVKSGRYPVQQAEYNDVDGVYTLMLLNTPAGVPPVYKTDKLQMARLTEEQLGKGEQTAVEIDGNEAIMYLTEDFKIEYVHAVTENQTNPQTGQPETVIVRRESNFWSPFAGALAGQAIGSLLFTPHYYVPPIYRPGGVMTGYGGYGRTYDGAINSYRSKYNSPPPVVKNRQNLRTTGNIRRNPASTANSRPNSSKTNKSTGSGFGNSKLRNSGNSNYSRPKSNTGFGSSRPSRSFSRPSSGGFRRRR